MYKRFIIPIVILLMLLPTDAIVKADTLEQAAEQVEHSILYTSAQHTKPEKKNQTITAIQSSLEGYTRVAENEELALYVEKKSLAIKLVNNKTGYVWASGLDKPEDYRLNATWKQIVQSGVTVEYTDRQGKLKTESILTNDSTPDVTLTDNGFSAKVFLLQAKLDFQIDVELSGNELVISVPQDKMKEDKYNKLVSMQIYPFFGAVNENDIPGYMFIPDGSGALIRYEKSKKTAGTPYIGQIYGQDPGIIRNLIKKEEIVPVQQVTMPVFGAVHGVKQNGYVGIVEGGDTYGEIIAYSSGITTDFNRISAKFNYRYQYYQPTSKSSSGINVYQKEMNDVQAKLRYVFLSGAEADYVGMAKTYQNYLVKQDRLAKKVDKVQVRLEFLGGEMKKGLFWNSLVPMTKIKQIPTMVSELETKGVNDVLVVYKGWSKGGLTGSLPAKFPFEKSLGNKADIADAIQSLAEKNIPLYFHTDYTKAYEGASGFSGSKDVAKKINSEIIANEDELPVLFLSPVKALNMAKKDVEKYRKYGIENLAIDTTGYQLFSDFSKDKKLTRMDTIEKNNEIFTELQDKVGPTALYQPNVYAWNQAEKYFDVPMNSSNYIYETDTVPFLQIVLKGYIPYYAPFSNFNSNPEDELLRLIEYGAYPSFILTEEASHLLAKTPSKNIYTSQFAIWKDEIGKQYNQVKETLGHVEGQTIESRIIPKSGVVEVTYSNGTVIIVNYTNSEYNKDGLKISAKSFGVLEGGEVQ